jgi:hypothetical protein
VGSKPTNQKRSCFKKFRDKQIAFFNWFIIQKRGSNINELNPLPFTILSFNADVRHLHGVRELRHFRQYLPFQFQKSNQNSQE